MAANVQILVQIRAWCSFPQVQTAFYSLRYLNRIPPPPMWLNLFWEKIETMAFDLLAMTLEVKLFTKLKQRLLDLESQTLHYLTSRV